MSTSVRRSVAVPVGEFTVGGGAPVVVQSMTNTDTADAEATADQIAALAGAGSELVRITVNNEAAAKAVPEVLRRIEDRGIKAPVIGDFHYNGHLLLPKHKEMARGLAKYRINPGNVGAGKRHDENFRTMVESAIEHGKPIRIGVNWGSLDQQLLTRMMDDNARRAKPLDAAEVMREAICTSALRSAEAAEGYGLARSQIVLSAKVSSPTELWQVYRRLGAACDHALHLGLTEAGMGYPGAVASAVALAPLLAEGIGDTIRVSLTPEPGGDRREEVKIAQRILQSLGMRTFVPTVTACPGCGRTTSSLFQELAKRVQTQLNERMVVWRKQYPEAATLKVAVMGCIVNGPGESKHADIGISLPGTGEQPRAPVYIDGKLHTTLQGPSLAEDFGRLVNQYVEQRYGRSHSQPLTR